MQAGSRKRWWSLVPVVALVVVPGRAESQSCRAVIGATATLMDMSEAGGVGIRLQSLAEQALERTARPDAGREWPLDTTVRVRRVQMRVQTASPPPDSSAADFLLTVIFPD